MSASRQTRARPRTDSLSIGLMAIGSSGPWEISINQSVAKEDHWFAQIEGPSVYLYFEIPSPDIMNQASRFLGLGEMGRKPRKGTLALATAKSTQVNLVRDDEFNDRYFLVIEPKGGLLAQFTIMGNDLVHLADAIRQAMEDLGDKA